MYHIAWLNRAYIDATDRTQVLNIQENFKVAPIIHLVDVIYKAINNSYQCNICKEGLIHNWICLYHAFRSQNNQVRSFLSNIVENIIGMVNTTIPLHCYQVVFLFPSLFLSLYLIINHMFSVLYIPPACHIDLTTHPANLIKWLWRI